MPSDRNLLTRRRAEIRRLRRCSTRPAPIAKKKKRALRTSSRILRAKGLIVLAVDMGEPKRKVKKCLEENPRSSKVVLAEDTTLAAICHAKTYPLYVLLDREGNIAGKQHGAAGEQAPRRLLAKAGLTDA